MRRSLRTVCALMICASAWSASAWSAPSEAHAGEAEDREEAKRLYAEARKLRAAGDADAALDRFRRAHELAPTPVTRLELARELEARRKLVEAQALAASVALLPVTATETSKSKVARREAQSFAASLEPRIATLRLTVEPSSDEVEVVLDGASLDRAKRSELLRVDPGEHRVFARRGDQIVEVPFALVEGESRSVELRLPEPVVEPPPAPLPAPPPVATTTVAPAPRVVAPPQEPTEPGGTDFGPLVPLSLTVAGLSVATGIVTGSIALSQASTLEARCPNERCAPEEHGLLATHQALTTTSTVTFVVGAALGAAGVVLWALEVDAPPSRQAGAGARSVASRTPLELRWVGTGLAVEGTWP